MRQVFETYFPIGTAVAHDADTVLVPKTKALPGTHMAVTNLLLGKTFVQEEVTVLLPSVE